MRRFKTAGASRQPPALKTAAREASLCLRAVTHIMPELELNTLLKTMSDPKKAVADAEAAYHNRVAEVADRIVGDGVRVVMLAGPSSSGKTTSANLIADAIRARGEAALVVSLDNFYRNADDPTYPRLEGGERDLEHPEALDISLIHKTLADIIAGRDFVIPKYDFSTGMRSGETGYEAKARQCVIIEGIHALNPILSDLPSDEMLKLFISVSTNIESGGDRLISGKKIRFIRRVVRDNLYRGMSAMRTLSVWESVLDGERKYLYPYRDRADIYFDTFHSFELSVMKPFADALITPEVVERSPYAEVVHGILRCIPAMDIDLIPEDSLIREFIPGGIYESIT